ncbi:MAG: hypothetical protein FJ403_01495 [Verrucomicrobia bacterium]|nr:hypothetical protein [Verrucomicrobiota bacterium]
MNPNFKPLPPIPTPAGQRWREFRIQVLPLLVFLGAVVATVIIWKQNLGAPTLQGEVEAVQAEVASPQAGVLTQLKVNRFQWVSQGEPVAVVVPTDPRAPLAMIQSEIDILRTRLEPRLSQQRNATDYERLRLEWLLQKVELATARVNLTRAENEHKRNQELFQARLISADLHELSLKNKEALQTEVEEKTKLIADVEQGLQPLSLMGDPQAALTVPDSMLATLKAQEEKLRAAQSKLDPLTLTAPIAGMVSVVYCQAGANVRDGDPIVAIRASQSDRIVGYLRQPFSLEPVVGMPVEIRTRDQKAIVRSSEILQVGAQFEPITNSLAIQRAGVLIDIGLPIAVSLPSDLKMRPGELVDLVIRPRK